MGRIISRREVVSLVKEEREKDRRIIFTNGCFDIIHIGHIELLRKAKDRGDILIVGLNSDRSVREIKGEGRPILDERSRATVLSSINYVDYVVIFDEKTPYSLIKAIKPDILLKGKDWKEDEIVGRDIAGEIARVDIVPGYSTTEILEKIRKTPRDDS